MSIQLVKDKISTQELAEIAKNQFGDFVKAVVDVEQRIMATGGELHADEEVFLMEEMGSRREHTWGINIYPQKSKAEIIEFDSMINIKPHYNNRSRGVEDEAIQKKIIDIVEKLIVW